MRNMSNKLIDISNNILFEGNKSFSVGDIVDVRNSNRDFRRFFCKIRKNYGENFLYLVEFLDGSVKMISLKSAKKVDSSTIGRYKEVLQSNVEKGSITGPTVDKMIKKIEYWVKKSDKD